jgi:hypothetical protein
MTAEAQNLKAIYHRRFSQTPTCRNRVWQELTASFFSTWIRPDATVLDLGCGYWDFFDRHIALSESSSGEALEIEGFTLERVVPRFLPYTLVNAPEYPIFMLKA